MTSTNAKEDLSATIRNKFPTTVAVLYDRMLKGTSWQAKTSDALEIYEVWMKSITLQMLIQYLDEDAERLQNDEVKKLNDALVRGIYKPSLGLIVDIFFHLLGAYREHQDWLFMPELHGIRWRSGGRSKVRKFRMAFDALVRMRNDIAHGSGNPTSEEEWQEKYEEVVGNLNAILEKFAFIQNYRIICKFEKGTVQQLRGLEPKLIEPITSEYEALQASRIYLDDCRTPGKFYELAPLFLPWPSEIFEWDRGGEVNDLSTASYHSYIKPKVRYSVATAWVENLVLTDETTRERFLQLFEERLDSFGADRREVESLEWGVFKEITDEITVNETEAIQDKFSKDLYLQRKHINLAFEHFLGSEKAAFVLLGKSGVGKSNFVLSMQETYMDRQDTCMLVLDSVRIAGDEEITATLTDLFTKRLHLRTGTQERKIEDIISEINKIEGIDGKKVVLAFDAVNENQEPHRLLGQIDRLISRNEYSWLKVVITSRPEAWQNMKRHCHLTESKYYRQPDTQELEVELRGFDVEAAGAEDWVAMDRFKPVELPEVYALYQDKYHLRSSFDELSPEMKVMLRDPLALRLVAETFGSTDKESKKEGVLPQSVQTSKLYKQYINSLINDKRLERTDIRVFLEKKILPLMFSPEGYRNTLDAEILTETINPKSGKSLAEEIELSDILPSTKKQVNQSFQNLVDADILVKQGTYSDYDISFKYERFYDYYGGKQLFEGAPDGKERFQWYKGEISKISDQPFLWGPVRQAMFLELERGGAKEDFRIIFRLLDSNDQILNDLLQSVLIWYVRDYPEKGLALLEKLYATRKFTYRQMAVRVAGFAGIIEILVRSGSDRNKSIRFTTIQSTYFFWQRDPKRGWEILEKWADRLRGRLMVPNMAIAESTLGLSILILTDRSNTSKPGSQVPDYQNLEIIRRLQVVWRKILSDLLFISEKETQRSMLRTTVRSIILSALIRFLFLIMRGSSRISRVRVGSPFHVLDEIFRKDVSERSVFLKLRPYWDVSDEGLGPIEDLLIECFDPDNSISVAAVELVIQLRAKRDGDQDLGIIEKIYHHFFDPEYPTMAPAQLVFNSGYILRRDPEPPTKEAWDIYTRLQESHLSVGGMYYITEEMVHECSYMEMYSTIGQHHTTRDQTTKLLVENVEASIAQYRRTLDLSPMPGIGAAPSIPATIAMFGTLGIVYKSSRIALEAMKPIITMLTEDTPLNKESDENYETILNLMANMLARFRLYYSDQVDNLLEDMNAPIRLKHMVRSAVVEEDLWGDYLAWRFGPFGLKTVFISQVREELWEILELTTQMTSLEDWLNLALHRIINFVYGAEVFPIYE